MKLSFSTRGWAHLNWEEWLDAGETMHFEGVEVYNLPKFPELMERSGPFHKYNIAATVRQMREKKLTIPCFDTSCDLSSNEENFVPSLRELIQIAKQMQVYDGLKFRNEDGSLNRTPSPHYSTEVLKALGLKPNDGTVQRIDGFSCYPPEYFCPKSFQTGMLKLTKNT